MLNLEEGGVDYTRCSDVDKQAVGEQFLQNARKWFARAVRERRLASNIPIERLILVTGFYKSANWEAAAMSSSSSAGELSFTIKINQAGGGFSFNWDSVQHLSPDYSTGHRHPTPQSLSPPFPHGLSTPRTHSNERQVLGACSDITRPTHVAGPRVPFERCCHQHAERNQCIFLQGFRIYDRLEAKRQVVERLVSEGSKPSWSARIKRFVANRKTSKPPGDQSCQRSSSAYDYYLRPVEGISETNICVSCHRV